MQSERAQRLAEALAAMPPGPSRDRFRVVLGEIEAADAAASSGGGSGAVTADGSDGYGWGAAAPESAGSWTGEHAQAADGPALPGDLGSGTDAPAERYADTYADADIDAWVKPMSAASRAAEPATDRADDPATDPADDPADDPAVETLSDADGATPADGAFDIADLERHAAESGDEPGPPDDGGAQAAEADRWADGSAEQPPFDLDGTPAGEPDSDDDPLGQQDDGADGALPDGGRDSVTDEVTGGEEDQATPFTRVPVEPAEPDLVPDKPRRFWRRRS